MIWYDRKLICIVFSEPEHIDVHFKHALADACLCKHKENLPRPQQKLKPRKNLPRPQQNLPRPRQNLPRPWKNLTRPQQNLPRPQQNLPKPHSVCLGCSNLVNNCVSGLTKFSAGYTYSTV